MLHMTVSVLCVFHLVFSVQFTVSRTVESSCDSPPLDLDFDHNWAENSTDSGGWYVPLYGKINHGKDDEAPEVFINLKAPPRIGTELDKEFCPRMIWSKNQIAQFYLHGKVWQTFHCKVQKNYASKLCRRIEAKQDTVNIFTTLTDNKSYYFVLRCWEDGRKDWAVASNVKFIDDETKKTVFEHVASLGFDPNSFNTVDYTKC